MNPIAPQSKTIKKHLIVKELRIFFSLLGRWGGVFNFSCFCNRWKHARQNKPVTKRPWEGEGGGKKRKPRALSAWRLPRPLTFQRVAKKGDLERLIFLKVSSRPQRRAVCCHQPQNRPAASKIHPECIDIHTQREREENSGWGTDGHFLDTELLVIGDWLRIRLHQLWFVSCKCEEGSERWTLR